VAPWTRRRLLRATAAAALGAAGDAFALEPRWLEVSRHDVPVEGLPAALHGLTIAQLSDVHLGGLGALHEAAFAAVRAADPALVVLTGDIVDNDVHLPALGELCRRLGAPGRWLVAIRGNWEHWNGVSPDALAATYGEAGVRLLANEHATLAPGVVVAAIDDACSHHDDAGAALRGLPQAEARVLVTHAPGVLDRAPPSAPRFGLAMAGHTHGGQVRAGPTPIMLPPECGRFLAGPYDTPFGRAYVSRGVGTSVIHARFFCRPELPIFRLVQG
jgi:hypothetical protein